MVRQEEWASAGDCAELCAWAHGRCVTSGQRAVAATLAPSRSKGHRVPVCRSCATRVTSGCGELPTPLTDTESNLVRTHPLGVSVQAAAAQDEVDFDLKSALDAVVALRAEIPEDAFTAPILGTERVGNGVVIGDDGLVLTIGYLITEAESIWLTANDGSVVQGHPLAYDFATGFGLVAPLGRLRAADAPARHGRLGRRERRRLS